MAEPHLTTHAPRRIAKHTEKQHRRIPTAVMVLAFVFVAGIGFVAGMFAKYPYDSSFNGLLGRNSLDLSSVQETYQALKANYDGTIDDAKLIEGANKGMVNALGDQYTIFMNQQESTQFDDSLTGNIGGGIGVEVGMRNNAPTVVRVLQDNPAEKAGLQINDVITQVNGTSVKDMTLNDVVAKIRGDAGTTVKLTVSRGGNEMSFSITRAVVNNPSAYGEVKGGIGVLTVTRFDDNTGALARQVAQDFKKQNVKGVILDLRGNGGGYVTAAQEVAGIWLDNQLVVTEKRGSEVVDSLNSTGAPILNGVPTVVLVNASSASASEIVSGALHDHKAATLVGETTFGKGSVQKLLSLTDGATLKVTIARWYTPDGINISEKGITPDKTVQRTVDDINAGRDPQLDAAMTSLGVVVN
ncbi:MAG TPA: S41 family peptidase [Dongiaceae bacterium]|nr:S41 family peptidase [Dongiaceae bacterium]